MHKQLKRKIILIAIGGTMALVSGSIALAGSLSVTNTFSSGSPAVAADMNQNFADVKTAVDDNDVRTTTNAGDIGVNTTAIGTNATDIGNNTATIGTNTTAIGTNQGGIDANASTIDANAAVTATNTADISSNTGAIDANTTAVTDHEARITTLEAGGGGGGGGGSTAATVNCGSGGSIQAAIDEAAPTGPLVVTINGTCNENVIVQRDSVTLANGTAGEIAGNTSSPTLTIDGQHRIKLQGITVSGGQVAMLVDNGATVALDGVAVGGSSTAEQGIDAIKNSILTLTGTNSITGGSTAWEAAAIELSGGAALHFKSGTTTVTPGTSSEAIIAELASRIYQDGASTIAITGLVELLENGFAIFENGTMNGDIEVSSNSSVTLEAEVADGYNLSVTGDVAVERSSNLDVYGDGVSVNGNVTVSSASSMVINDGASISGELRSDFSASVAAWGGSVGTLHCNGGSVETFPQMGIATETIFGNDIISGENPFVDPNWYDGCNLQNPAP